MSRAVWFVAGAAAGVYGVVRARRAAESLTPDGLRDRAAGLGVGAQLFAAEVREGMAEKETELRQRLQLVGGTGTRELAGRDPEDETTHPSLEHPTSTDHQEER